MLRSSALSIFAATPTLRPAGDAAPAAPAAPRTARPQCPDQPHGARRSVHAVPRI